MCRPRQYTSRRVRLDVEPVNQTPEIKGNTTMNSIAKRYVQIRETLLSNARGQTMTEYALILAAIAVVVYGVYAAMGNNIGTLANGIDSSLTNA